MLDRIWSKTYPLCLQLNNMQRHIFGAVCVCGGGSAMGAVCIMPPHHGVQREPMAPWLPTLLSQRGTRLSPSHCLGKRSFTPQLLTSQCCDVMLLHAGARFSPNITLAICREAPATLSYDFVSFLKYPSVFIPGGGWRQAAKRGLGGSQWKMHTSDSILPFLDTSTPFLRCTPAF